MKKQLQLSLISIAVASLALSSASFAANAKGEGYKGENYKGEAMAPCPQPLTLNGGFYIGADVCYDMYQANMMFLLQLVQTSFPQVLHSALVAGLAACLLVMVCTSMKCTT